MSVPTEPSPAEGNLIKAEWLQRYDQPPTEFTKVVCALDAAAKTGVSNDYSAHRQDRCDEGRVLRARRVAR